ncbi:hypothetical protein KMT30_05905 [Streptomyces sp. IBSBF 2953]|nr:hypothetical protein [Streptomyces hayashii]
MQPAFTRGFRLHHNGRTYDGAEFPSARVIVLDDPEYGLATAATSMDELLKGYHGARVEWPAEEEEARAAAPDSSRLHEGVTVHAVPLPGSHGISSCCGRPPCEFVGERLTRDPSKVTCKENHDGC